MTELVLQKGSYSRATAQSLIDAYNACWEGAKLSLSSERDLNTVGLCGVGSLMLLLGAENVPFSLMTDMARLNRPPLTLFESGDFASQDGLRFVFPRSTIEFVERMQDDARGALVLREKTDGDSREGHLIGVLPEGARPADAFYAFDLMEPPVIHKLDVEGLIDLKASSFLCVVLVPNQIEE